MKRFLSPTKWTPHITVLTQPREEFSTKPQQEISTWTRRCGWLLPLLCAASLQAQPDTSVDAVTLKGGQVWCLRAAQLDVLTNSLEMTFDVEVISNGVFTVAKGKERVLAEGQTIRKDGWLINADASMQPVFDHVSMRAGQAIVVRDGQAMPLTDTMTFPNKLVICSDGSCIYPSGTRTRLADGQFFRMDGSSIPGKDAVTFKNGRVVAMRDGGFIPLNSVQIIGMADGTRVRGDGLLTRRDGTTVQLTEGQTIFFEARAVRQ
jgi:hypothetical protein